MIEHLRNICQMMSIDSLWRVHKISAEPSVVIAEIILMNTFRLLLKNDNIYAIYLKKPIKYRYNCIDVYRFFSQLCVYSLNIMQVCLYICYFC